MKLEDLTYEQCLRQGLGPMVFPRRLGDEGISGLGERQQMKAVCVQNMQTQAKMLHVLTQAWQALEDAGIRAVLMKGLGLAQYYSSPEQRQWGDIDIYVGPEQYHPACAVMRATFPEALKFDEELDHYKHYNLIAAGVSIEVHRVTMGMMHPRDVRRYARMEQYGMEHAAPIKYINTDKHACGAINIDKEEKKNGYELRVPEVTFNALFVMLHSWEHMMHGSANLRQICDLALLLKHEQEKIDRERLKRWLEELRLMDVWQLYMYVAVEMFGVRAEEAPFYNKSEEIREKSEKMVSDILAERRVESGESREQSNRWLRKWGTMKERLRHAEEIAAYSPEYARHMKVAVLLSGAKRLFAKDRRWE